MFPSAKSRLLKGCFNGKNRVLTIKSIECWQWKKFETVLTLNKPSVLTSIKNDIITPWYLYRYKQLCSSNFLYQHAGSFCTGTNCTSTKISRCNYIILNRCQHSRLIKCQHCFKLFSLSALDTFYRQHSIFSVNNSIFATSSSVTTPKYRVLIFAYYYYTHSGKWNCVQDLPLRDL